MECHKPGGFKRENRTYSAKKPELHLPQDITQHLHCTSRGQPIPPGALWPLLAGIHPGINGLHSDGLTKERHACRLSAGSFAMIRLHCFAATLLLRKWHNNSVCISSPSWLSSLRCLPRSLRYCSIQWLMLLLGPLSLVRY
jgi:hypothetical protein